MEILILTSIVVTLFIVFGIATYREFSRMGKEGYKQDPNAKMYGRDALFVLAAKLFEDEKVPKRQKKIIYKAVNRTMSDMESDGIYFPEEIKEKLKEYREEMHCEYSGLPSVKSYVIKKQEKDSEEYLIGHS